MLLRLLPSVLQDHKVFVPVEILSELPRGYLVR